MATINQVLELKVWNDTTVARERLLGEGNEVDTPPTADQVERYSRRLLRNRRWRPDADAITALNLVIGTRDDPVAQPRTYRGGFLRGTQPAALPWRHFSRELIALQLIVRIVDYKFIEQKSHSLCGPVTFIHDIAKRKPHVYAAYVIGLAENRLGTIEGMTVKVKSSSRLLSKRVTQPDAICEADYIALASLRDGSNVLAYRSAFTHTMLEGGTSSADIVRWMRKTGYQNVEDHTHLDAWRLNGLRIKSDRTNFGYHVMRPHLNRMAQALAMGQTVMMCAAGNLARTAVGRTSRDPLLMRVFGGHFTLVNAVDVTQTGAIFDLVTWGTDGGTTVVEIPWSKLTSWYGGFICGLP